MRLLLPSVTFAQGQLLSPHRSGAVIVTGSNIPTAEETGPNPVDTYRPADLEKLGIRNATDLPTFLPQETGATVNLNIANGGDGLSNSTCAVCCRKKLWFSSMENASPLVRWTSSGSAEAWTLTSYRFR